MYKYSYSYPKEILKKLGYENPDKLLNCFKYGDAYFLDHKYTGSGESKKILLDDEKVNNLIYKFKKIDFKIFWYESKYDNKVYYSINNNSDINNSQCMLLSHEYKSKIIHIDNISNHDNCSYNGTIKNNIGRVMLEVALNFIDTHMKEKYKIKYIILKDNSVKLCNKNNKMIPLSDMYMLLNGNTWYGKYGFRPSDDDGNKNYLTKQYDMNKKILDKAIIKDYPEIIKIIKKGYKKCSLDTQKYINIDKIIDAIKKYDDKKVCKVMKMILLNYDFWCELFYHIYNKINILLGLYSFKGVSFRLKLD